MPKEGHVVDLIDGTCHYKLRLGQANRLEPLTLHLPYYIVAILLNHFYAELHDITVLSSCWGLSIGQGHQTLLLIIHNDRWADIF